MPANYDKTAWFYDALAKLVYGNTLIKAQQYFLFCIPPNSKILIIGGGTGRILEDVTQQHLAGLAITYVEVSANMIARSRKRDISESKVEFITDAVENINMPNNFNVIITSFLFDNYSNEGLKETFPHISRQLKPGGIWLNTDFQLTGKWWQWILLEGMYAFFKLFSRIEASKVPDVDLHFKNGGFQLMDSKAFYGQFVLAQVWQKHG